MRNRYLWITALTVVVGLLVLLTRQKGTSMVQRLPDGTYLQIMTLDYGNRHQYTLPSLKPWQGFLAERLPLSWTARFGWRESGASFSYVGPPGQPTLGFVTFHETANASNIRPAFVQVLDEKGVEYVTAFPSTVVGGTFRGRRHETCFWPIAIYPKDARRIVLRFAFTIERTTNQITNLVEFNLPNPPRPK